MAQNVQLVENNADPEEVSNTILAYIRQIHTLEIGLIHMHIMKIVIMCHSIYVTKHLNGRLG